MQFIQADDTAKFIYINLSKRNILEIMTNYYITQIWDAVRQGRRVEAGVGVGDFWVESDRYVRLLLRMSNWIIL